MYLGHLAFMVYACISPPGTAGEQWSLAGMMVLRSALNKDKILGALCRRVLFVLVRRGVIGSSPCGWCDQLFDPRAHSASTVGAQMGAQAASGAAGGPRQIWSLNFAQHAARRNKIQRLSTLLTKRHLFFKDTSLQPLTHEIHSH